MTTRSYLPSSITKIFGDLINRVTLLERNYINSGGSTSQVAVAAYRASSTNTSFASNDMTIKATATGLTFTLPSAGGFTVLAGSIVFRAVLGIAGTLFIAPAAGQTINGSTGSVTINSVNAALSFLPDNTGTNWMAF